MFESAALPANRLRHRRPSRGGHGGWLRFDRQLPDDLTVGARAIAIEGCDHTLATCASRFANAVNFRGEPFLPGNDLLVRYGNPAG